jgi:hypothetical protein
LILANLLFLVGHLLGLTEVIKPQKAFPKSLPIPNGDLSYLPEAYLYRFGELGDHCQLSAGCSSVTNLVK